MTGAYLEAASDIKVQPTEDGRTMIGFRTENGIVGAIADDRLLSALTAAILQNALADQEGGLQAQPPEEFQARPVEVTALGYAPAEEGTGGYLLVKMGKLTLTLACEDEMLAGLGEQLQARAAAS